MSKYEDALERLIKDDYEYFDIHLDVMTRCEDTRKGDIELLRYLIAEKTGDNNG